MHLLMFLPKHSHPLLLPHTASLLRLRRAPRARVSETQGWCQEHLTQPRGGLLSALCITSPTNTSQVLRPPESTGLTESHPASQWLLT